MYAEQRPHKPGVERERRAEPAGGRLATDTDQNACGEVVDAPEQSDIRREGQGGAQAVYDVHVVDALQQLLQVRRLIGIVERCVKKERMLGLRERDPQSCPDAVLLLLA